MCGPQHLEHFKDRGEVWACVFPVPGIALDIQQKLRKGLLRRADRTQRRCRWLDGVQGPWRGALSLGGRSWLTPRSLHSEGAQRVALGTVRGRVWVGRTALTWGWPPAFHSFHLPLPTALGHAQCRGLGTHPSFMSSLVWPEGYGARGGAPTKPRCTGKALWRRWVFEQR